MDNLLKDNDREVENNTREQLEEPTVDKEDTDSEGETSEEQPGELKLPKITQLWLIGDRPRLIMDSEIMSPCLNTIDRQAWGDLLYRGGDVTVGTLVYYN